MTEASSTPSEIDDDISLVLKEIRMIQDSLLRLIDWTCHLQNKIKDLNSGDRQSKTPIASSVTKSYEQQKKIYHQSIISSNISNQNQYSTTSQHNKKKSASITTLVYPNIYSQSNCADDKSHSIELAYNNDEKYRDGNLMSLFDDECSSTSNDISILTTSEFSLLPCEQLLTSSNKDKGTRESSSSSDSDSGTTSSESLSKYGTQTETFTSAKLREKCNDNSLIGASSLFTSPRILPPPKPSTRKKKSVQKVMSTTSDNGHEEYNHSRLYPFQSLLDNFSCHEDSLHADVDLFDSSQKEILLSSFQNDTQKAPESSRNKKYAGLTTKRMHIMSLKHAVMRAKWQLKHAVSKLRKY